MEAAEHVDANTPHEGLVIEFRQTPALNHSGVVDEDVEAAETREGALDHCVGIGAARYVRDESLHRRACGAQGGHRLGGFHEVDCDHGRARASQAE